MSAFWLVIIIILLALIFDFLNGANDRANAIATTVATKALTPLNALIVASVFNLFGAFASTRVAEIIGKGIVDTESLAPDIFFIVLISGLIGAIIWVFFCTLVGIPISVTHSLVGGLLGAGITAGGVIHWDILTNKVFLAIVLGPFVGLIAGLLIFSLVSWLIYLVFKHTPSMKVEGIFRKGQIITTPFMAFSHGMNDTQNAMGVITVALLAGGFIQDFDVPLWVMISCGVVMALGTFLLGWRVMETLGWKLTKVEAKHGFSAEAGAGLAIVAVSLAGMPASTTHIVASSVIGGTFFQNLRRIRWSEVERMITAWIITIPLSALIGGASYWLVQFGL